MQVIKKENSVMRCFAVSTNMAAEAPVTRLLYRFSEHSYVFYF